MFLGEFRLAYKTYHTHILLSERYVFYFSIHISSSYDLYKYMRTIHIHTSTVMQINELHTTASAHKT